MCFRGVGCSRSTYCLNHSPALLRPLGRNACRMMQQQWTWRWVLLQLRLLTLMLLLVQLVVRAQLSLLLLLLFLAPQKKVSGAVSIRLGSLMALLEH